MTGNCDALETTATARDAGHPSATERDFLRRFIGGELPQEDRQAACEMLAARPHWLEWVAEEVRKRRATSAG